MTKIKKRLSIITLLFTFFVTFLIASAIGFTVPAKAYTIDHNEYPQTDGCFSFASGAAVSKITKKKIAFTLHCDDQDIIDYTTWGVYDYQFTLYRVNSNNTLAACYYQRLLMSKDKDGNFSVSTESSNPGLNVNKFSGTIEYGVNSNGTLKFDADKNSKIVFIVESAYTEYVVTFNATISLCTGTKWVWSWNTWPVVYQPAYTFSSTKYQVTSDARSYYYIINAINEAGNLSTEFTDSTMLTYANSVLVGESKTIKVKYLVNIENTPFAKAETATVSLKTVSDSVSVSDVASALNKATMNVLMSVCMSIDYDSANNIYVAHYAKSVWLNAKTVDGNNLNYYLDCNLSFQDFYKPFVTDGVFDDDLYEYIFYTEIIGKYSALANYTPDKVYGYFGYIVIPQTYTFNQAWAELFGKQTTFSGVVKNFEYDELLTLAAYNKLLTDYQYTWLARIWNDVIGAVTGGSWNATHFIIYADTTTTEAYIANNGATNISDNNGLIRNDVTSFVDYVITKIKSKSTSIKIVVILILIFVCYLGYLYFTRNVLKSKRRYKKK